MNALQYTNQGIFTINYKKSPFVCLFSFDPFSRNPPFQKLGQKSVKKFRFTDLHPSTILKRSLTYLTDFYLSVHRFTKCRLYLFHAPISLIFICLRIDLQSANFIYFIHLSSLIFICLRIDLRNANFIYFIHLSSLIFIRLRIDLKLQFLICLCTDLQGACNEF